MTDMKPGDQNAEPAQKLSSLPAAEPTDTPEPIRTGPDSSVWDWRKQRRINRYILLALMVLLTLALIPVFKIFFVPIILAATFTTLFYPVYKKILKLFKGNRAVSSLTCCILLLVCLIIPFYMIILVVVKQTPELYQSATPVIKDVLNHTQEWSIRIHQFHYIQKFWPADANVQELAQNAAGTFAKIGTFVINRTSTSVFVLIATLFITLFTMFYFFMDGEKILKKLKYLSPLRGDYEDLLFNRFLMIARGTVGAVLIIGITQGTLGALTLLIFGIKSWLIWGLVMVILAMIPLMGTWMVLIPAAVSQLITGHIWQGIFILLISVLIISNIDNIIRARFVGQSAQMHDLLVFFSALGGIAVFGVMGFIIGPVMTALLVTVIDLYEEEFKASLDALD